MRLIALCLLLSFAACTQTRSLPGVAKKIRIGFLLATMNEERYQKDKSYFEQAATAKGAEVVFASSDDKVDVETAKVEALLSKGIDVLVIQPVNTATASSVVSLAKKDGVPVISYDRLVSKSDIDLYVTQDSFKVGVLQAEDAVKRTNGKGNYIILMGEAGHSVANEITRGVMSVLEKNPNVKVVVQQNHPGWSTSLALSTTENALTRYHNNIQAILANNDGMALGAIRALEEQKLGGKVVVEGADADLAALKDVVKGSQTMTVFKGIQPLAEAAVSAAMDLAQKKKPVTSTTAFDGKREVPSINTPVLAVTKDNIRDTVIAAGFHTEDEIYGTAQKSKSSGR